MRKLSLIILLCVFYAAQARVAIKVSGDTKFLISNGIELNIQGSMVFDETASIQNDGTVRIKNSENLDRSDFINNASENAVTGKGTVIMSGISEQVIGGTQPSRFHRLIIENTSNMGVILDSDIYIGDSVNNTGGLDLRNGIISSGDAFQNQTIHILNNKYDAIKMNTSGVVDSYIATKLQRRIKSQGDTLEYAYPVGSYYSNVYAPLVFKFKEGDMTLSKLAVTPSNFELGYITGLLNIETAPNSSSFYNELHDELFFEVEGLDKSNNKVTTTAMEYDIYMNIEGFSGIKTNKYGILSRLPRSDSRSQDYRESIQSRLNKRLNKFEVSEDFWTPELGKLDPENSKYRDFNTSKYARRTGLKELPNAFALATIDDLDGLTSIKRLFSNRERERGLVVDGIEFIDSPVQMDIYNTDGNRVYHHKDYAKAQDDELFRGEPNDGFGSQLNGGQPVPNGTYYVLLSTNNQVFKKRYIHLQFTK